MQIIGMQGARAMHVKAICAHLHYKSMGQNQRARFYTKAILSGENIYKWVS